MNRIVAGVVAVLVVAAVAGWSVSGAPGDRDDGELKISIDDRNPWTNLDLNNKPTDFQFAIVTDRTGGRRPGVFAQGVKKVNLLQPEFVLSVGDLIEGYSEDPGMWALEWSEFESMIDELEMPFFFCAGNHDISNLPMSADWTRRFGRSYYSFVYRDVLFMVLNTEDPPTDPYHIGEEQQKWARQVLDVHANVRWTFVILHKPTWTYPGADPVEAGWQSIEDALGNRKYTVFAGHKHTYAKYIHRGREYYMLATTGGGSNLSGFSNGKFDHFVWVTMKDDEPVIANLLLDGVADEDVRRVRSQ